MNTQGIRLYPVSCVENTQESLLPSSEYTGESNLWLLGDECTRESRILGGEYTRESRLLRGEYTGESKLPGGEYTGELRHPCGEYIGESPLRSVIWLKSKLFLRMSDGTRRSCLTKSQTQKKSRDTIPLNTCTTNTTIPVCTVQYPGHCRVHTYSNFNPNLNGLGCIWLPKLWINTLQNGLK